jgi:hypothetical protein
MFFIVKKRKIKEDKDKIKIKIEIMKVRRSGAEKIGDVRI